MNESGEAALRRPFLWPLAIFIVIGAFLGIGLTLDPREIPSPLLDRPVPRFELAPVKGWQAAICAARCRWSTYLRPGARRAATSTRCG
jgi:cytochrome c biogenesis protein CcmG/thiol:disulfide interchange protein DsbE